jgi:hypothetical protein
MTASINGRDDVTFAHRVVSVESHCLGVNGRVRIEFRLGGETSYSKIVKMEVSRRVLHFICINIRTANDRISIDKLMMNIG